MCPEPGHSSLDRPRPSGAHGDAWQATHDLQDRLPEVVPASPDWDRQETPSGGETRTRRVSRRRTCGSLRSTSSVHSWTLNGPARRRSSPTSTETRLQAFCVKHRYSGRRPAAELLARLRTAPAGTTDATLNPAVRDAVLAQVAVLKALTAAEKALGQSVVAHLEQHPDAAIFTSLPRSGRSAPPRYWPSGVIPGQPMAHRTR